jgi:hypothetical protein
MSSDKEEITEARFAKLLDAVRRQAINLDKAARALRSTILGLVLRDDRNARDELRRKIAAAEIELSLLDDFLVAKAGIQADLGYNGLMMEAALLSIKAEARNLVARQLVECTSKISGIEMHALARATLYVTVVVLVVTCVAAWASVVAVAGGAS